MRITRDIINCKTIGTLKQNTIYQNDIAVERIKVQSLEYLQFSTLNTVVKGKITIKEIIHQLNLITLSYSILFNCSDGVDL